MKFLCLLFFVNLFAFVSAAQTGQSQEVYLEPEKIQKRVVKKVFPEIPPKIKEFHAKGTIYVRVFVDRKGTVVKANWVAGLRPVKEYIENAVAEWKFQALEVEGKQTPFRGTIKVVFWYGYFVETTPY